MDMYSIIKSPVITEKATKDIAEGKVCFWVDVRANKQEIKTAVEKIFNVKVDSINTQIVPGKLRRMGRFAGRTSMRKKAYVKLKEGHTIDIFGSGGV